ncbi:AfsR/SARP family transcriptional regulator [Streptomyces himalayensis]|uniref:AfsR/SARP family transcriptional regulator n=1 Tax=Streptomyces himalayensis subsp. himalayensis TaxID=2756131 RepID=A0A7W0DP96_9ACTN|nr:BTAD domain-containing putative transcriptional regulator [Streptomyces himalayensis]MBA2948716.1 AfsR/SARP family transcriptional regulator [Streptomyces himalayensis subsp. himalayensis]
MDPVRYRFLGPTQALRPDGTLVPVGGARLRALLTVLALRAGRSVPAAVLVDEVWGDEPPADATGALQALVARLRRALGADAVASVGGGYRLCATAEDIDLYRFERLAGEGARALSDGDPAKAAVVLDDALALWHGPALADLPDGAAESARWEARRLDARRTRLTAAVALGQAEQVLPELAALCGSHPLDEPLHLLHLRALRAAGRTAEALAAYESLRHELADRLGSDPGPELRALHTELLRGAAPEERGRAAAPSPSPSYAGSAVPRDRTTPPAPDGTTPPPVDRATPPPPDRATPPPPGNLRARLTSFVGREADIDAIRGDLAATRLVTLLGPGGAGKTRLSQEAAETVRDAARDGVWLAELAPVDDPEAVPEAVLTAVGARETVLRGAGAEEMRAVADRHDDPLVRLAEHCARRRMLLILDNCEHVVDAAAHLVEHLLERCPELRILATSREPLGVPGELLRPVEPLPLPVALRLLADRGAAARPGFRIDSDEEAAAAAAEICRRLDGLPLAIELAAARLRMLTLRQIADRLDDRFRLLSSGSRTVLPRQQTLRAVVDWSWDLLDEDERAVLRRLSVFAGGCDLAAAEAVCGAAALQAIGSLVDKSLVVAAPSAGGDMRYRLLETVAEYAGERLDEAGEREAVARAHLTYYRELARLADPLLRGPGQSAAIERFETEYENLRTALRHAVAAHDEQEALCLVHSLFWYWQMRDLRIEARNWSREVMALGPDPFTSPAQPVPPVHERCTDAPPPMSPELLEEARRGVHLVHLACMDTELDAWNTPQAQAKLRAISETYRPGMPQTCRSPGNLWFFAVLLTGDMKRTHAVIDESIRTCRELGYAWELGMALQLRANILANRSDWAGDATRDADEALEVFTRLGDAWGTAEALSARGEAQERKGEYAAAAQTYEAAITYAQRLGARAQAAVLRARLGAVLIESGEPERGEEMLRDVVEQSRGTANDAMPAARLFLAMWLGRTRRTEEAREQLEALRSDFGAAAFVVFAGFMLGVEAWLEVVDGRYEQGLVKARQAMERSREPLAHMMAPQMPSVHLTTGAVALAGLDGGGRARDAARLLGAARALLPPRHFSTPLEREMHEQGESAARAVLGDEAYDAAYAEGGGLTLDEAAALL